MLLPFSSPLQNEWYTDWSRCTLVPKVVRDVSAYESVWMFDENE